MYLVDKEDRERVGKYSWWNHNGYLRTKIDGKNVYQHRFIMDVSDPKTIVDHINGNKKDNRKENLRIVSKQANAFNSRKAKGFRRVSGDRFCAYIKVDGVQRSIGIFSTPKEAYKAYSSFRRRVLRKCICN